jgi:signal transduction histidine kinase
MPQKRDLNERLAFLNFTGEDEQCLCALEPVFERHAERLVQAFYRHLLSFRETRALLADPVVKNRLIVRQREYLLSLAGTQIDESYIVDRRRIGETHERVGLGPGWYLGAYSLYYSLLLPVISETYRDDPARSERAATALMKVLMLDAELAMEAYMESREVELEHLNRELAAMGRDLQREYEEQSSELREISQRARAAEELASVATLVAGLAHEIGTPMSVIQGHTELLESSLVDDQARKRLKTIQDQVDRISNIIQTLLSLSRPRELIRAPVNLREVMEQTLEFLSEKIRKRAIQVVRRTEEVPLVSGDHEKLQQLFLNLFLNAADAMPEGGTLTVTLAPAEGEAVRVSVSDTGMGIEAERLSEIFQPFHTSKAAGEGSGLGLAVAHGVVQEHGGVIEVESTLGHGTRFELLLPCKGEPEP